MNTQYIEIVDKYLMRCELKRELNKYNEKKYKIVDSYSLSKDGEIQ